MHITGMTIGGIPPFTDPVEFKFHERVNVFIGPNATGKSTLLRQLSSYYKTFDNSEGNLKLDFSLDLECSIVGTNPIDGTKVRYPPSLPLITIPSVRVGYNLDNTLRDPRTFLNDIGENTSDDHPEALIAQILQTYTSFRTGVIFMERARHGVKVLSDNADDQSMYGGIPDLGISGAEMAKLRGDELYDAIQQADRCAQLICQDILYSEPAQDAYFTSRSVSGRPVPHIEMATCYQTKDVDEKGNAVPPLTIRSLSDGTGGTLGWVRLLALNLLWQRGWYHSIDSEERPAILLIDEIENHLHPTWQRRVIPALLEHFPGLQIFATTHSPFVVAGLKAGQVHMLKRDGNGVVTASTNEEDIVGWTSDEILRNLMGVADPTDDATAAAAQELRQLRDAGPSATPEAEERRQKRIQELRRLVDRDLLAGGQGAAQRELFEQQFAEALEKYRQSRDLGQEND